MVSVSQHANAIPNMTQAQTPEATSPKRRPWIVLIISALIVLAAIPWILAKTTLRDRSLNAIVSSEDITVTSTDASFGYFTPLSLSGLQIRSKDDATMIDVSHIQADHSWLGLLISRPELGTFRFERPKINVLIDPKKSNAESEQPQEEKPNGRLVRLPNLAADINDASIVVRTAMSSEPPIDLEKIQLTVRLDRQAEGSVLRVDPATVFDHQKITPALCGQGLQLIAPLLADEVDARGEFSLRLDHFQIPMGPEHSDRDKATHIEGELKLHQASVGLRNTIAKGISDFVLQLVGIGAPDRLTVAKDLGVRFQVVDGRVHHEGLALLLPHGDSAVEFMSSGSVGLDETLDLQVAVKLPETLLGGRALVQRITKEPIVLAITGTLDEPQVKLAAGGGLVKSIQGLVNGEVSEDVTEDAVSEVVTGAVDAVNGILDGLRQRAGERAEQREEPVDDRLLLPRLRERLRDRPLRRDRRGSDAQPEPPQEPVDI